MYDPNRVTPHVLHEPRRHRRADLITTDQFRLQENVPKLNGRGGQELIAFHAQRKVTAAFADDRRL